MAPHGRPMTASGPEHIFVQYWDTRYKISEIECCFVPNPEGNFNKDPQNAGCWPGRSIRCWRLARRLDTIEKSRCCIGRRRLTGRRTLHNCGMLDRTLETGRTTDEHAMCWTGRWTLDRTLDWARDTAEDARRWRGLQRTLEAGEGA